MVGRIYIYRQDFIIDGGRFGVNLRGKWGRVQVNEMPPPPYLQHCLPLAYCYDVARPAQGTKLQYYY